MQFNSAVFHRSVHLDESRLEPLDLNCPFCSSTNRQPVYILQKTPEVLLLQCNSCHAISASRIPTDEALTKYYSGYYDSSASQVDAKQVTLDNPERLAKKMADMCTHCQNNTSVSILDFGGGDGTISHLTAMQLIRRGVGQVKITVVDFGEKVVRPQDSRITINRVSSLTDIQNLYGFVIASAVIEHHPRPRLLLRDLLQRMDKGGLFYVRTPSIFPVMKLLQPVGVRVDYTYPAHIHDLGQKFWENFFTEARAGEFHILKSRPSIVATTIYKHFLNTLAAHLFKAPWYLFGKSYKYVGGWEVFVRKNLEENVISR